MSSTNSFQHLPPSFNNNTNHQHIFAYHHSLLPQGFFTTEMEKIFQINQTLPGGTHLITTSIDESKTFCLGGSIKFPSQPSLHVHISSPPTSQHHILMGPTPPMYQPRQPFLSPPQHPSSFPHPSPPHGSHSPFHGYPCFPPGSTPPTQHFHGANTSFLRLLSFWHLFLWVLSICSFAAKILYAQIGMAIHIHGLKQRPKLLPPCMTVIDGSRTFAVGMLKKFWKDALAYFLGPNSEAWHSHGVEMWKYLLV